MAEPQAVAQLLGQEFLVRRRRDQLDAFGLGAGDGRRPKWRHARHCSAGILFLSRLLGQESRRGEIEKVALIHRFRIPLRCLEGVDPPDPPHLRLHPLLLPFG